MKKPPLRPFAAALALATLALPLAAADTFLKSDDYKEGDEVVGKFLGDEDYALMIEDLERGDVDLDWAWVKTADGKLKRKVKALGFQLAAGQTVEVPEVVNVHRGMTPPAVVESARKNLVAAMESLGLKVVAGGADYKLAAALVDVKQDSTYAFVAMIKPFVELELRLTSSSGEVLARVRHQSHGDNAEVASFNLAETLVKFLR